MRQYFAKIENDIVVDIACVEKSFMDANPERYDGEWVECFQEVENPATNPDYAYINGSYNRLTGKFGYWQPPVTPIVDPPLPDITANLRSE